jgi:hypothetical protein
MFRLTCTLPVRREELNSSKRSALHLVYASQMKFYQVRCSGLNTCELDSSCWGACIVMFELFEPESYPPLFEKASGRLLRFTAYNFMKYPATDTSV